ncbi:MAG: hypothetical protein JO077_15240 [Verrucomicrobia bacterium]|nr:hypothetical protein [Verrucomicrobiota bacterium]
MLWIMSSYGHGETSPWLCLDRRRSIRSLEYGRKYTNLVLPGAYAPNLVDGCKQGPDNNDECRITAYAIGLRHRTGAVAISTKIFEHEGKPDNHPTAEVAAEAGYTLVGGGACVPKIRQGNYLTASYPDFQKRKWIANSKDHLAGHADWTTIIAYAIGLIIWR